MLVWIKVILSIIFLIIAFGIFIFCVSLWAIRVPKLDAARMDPEAREKLDSWFEDLSTHPYVPFNGTAYIRRGDEILLSKAYGSDSVDRPLTLDTPLRLGSLSKQFTAVGVLTLVEKGQVDLDASLSTYIPACDFDVSVSSLLDHTSGIPDIIYGRASEKETLTLDRVESLICDGSIKAKGNKFQYSNTGYLLAARLIERVSEKSFEDYMQEAVFDLLEMNNSRVWNLISTREFPERAGSFSFTRDKKKPLEPTYLDGVAGDGGVFSTINDLEKWDQFWSDNRLISSELKQRAMTPENGDYAFGWMRDGDSVWHNGSWLGARTYIRRNLKTGDLIILLDNSSNVNIDSIGENIATFLGE